MFIDGREQSISSPATPRPARDARLDFWRGLCLVDMVLVHLVYAKMQFGPFLTPLFGEYARFAAGGFVFIAGMGVGRFFLPKVKNPVTRTQARVTLLRRAGIILIAHCIWSVATTLVNEYRCIIPQTATPLSIMRDVFLLRMEEDLLPMYVLLIALAPVMLELLRRSWGVWVLAGVSVSLFVFGQIHPDWLILRPHPLFRPLLWQAIFIAGLIGGSYFDRYDGLTRRGKFAVSAVAWSVFAVLFLADYSSDFGLPAMPMGLSFTKNPLSVGELLRYLAITACLITTTDLLWPLIRPMSVMPFLATLGKRSLLVYVVHTFLVDFCQWACGVCWWAGYWQMLLILPTILLLWMIAFGAEWWKRLPAYRAQEGRMMAPAAT